jgi:predicted dehydrogenase
MRTINFGIIGCGLMGREFGSAVLRWSHLTADIPTPKIVGVCDVSDQARQWFNVFEPKYSVADYRELLANDDIEAIYCAVPHNMHEQFYVDIINSGKHLMAEKPFGIDKQANANILKAIAANPGVFVRCSGEYPFFPACRQLIQWIEEDKFGTIIEIKAGFNHSSDMDLSKPINWKRKVEMNGEYGCMGDLGIHTQHIPLRMGFVPKNVYASLSKIVKERPDGKGGSAECKTWDNATLICEVDGKHGETFPMYLEAKRMEPGATNQWYIEIKGINASAKFSTDDPNAFYYTSSWGKEQAWCRLGVGCKPQLPTITGSIFEFGFSDSILQMWGAFVAELSGNKVEFGCFTPEETRLSHLINTAALESYKQKRAINIVR